MTDASSTSWVLQRGDLGPEEARADLVLWAQREDGPDGRFLQEVIRPYQPTSWTERLQLLGHLVRPAPEGSVAATRLLGWGLSNPGIAALGGLLATGARRQEWLNHPRVPRSVWMWRMRLLAGHPRERACAVLQRPDAPVSWRRQLLGLAGDPPQVTDAGRLQAWATLIAPFPLQCRSLQPEDWEAILRAAPGVEPAVRDLMLHRLSFWPGVVPAAVWMELVAQLLATPSDSSGESVSREVFLRTRTRLLLRPDVPAALREAVKDSASLETLLALPHQPGSGWGDPSLLYAGTIVAEIHSFGRTAWADRASRTGLEHLIRHIYAAGVAPTQSGNTAQRFTPLIAWVLREIQGVARETTAARPPLPRLFDLLSPYPEILLAVRHVLMRSEEGSAPAAIGCLDPVLRQVPPGAWRTALLSNNHDTRLLAMEGLRFATECDGPSPADGESLCEEAVSATRGRRVETDTAAAQAARPATGRGSAGGR